MHINEFRGFQAVLVCPLNFDVVRKVSFYFVSYTLR